MKLNPFKNKNTSDNKKAKESLKNMEKAEEAREELEENIETTTSSVDFSGASGLNTHRVLRNFYVSEKASLGHTMNQYTFKVANATNKSEVKKEVANLFNVKVKEVKMVKIPRKRRSFGRHPGFKPSFKKAIVVLEEGYSIGQAKP